MRRAYGVLLVALAACMPDETPPVGPGPEPSIDAQLRQQFNQWGVIPIGTPAPQDPALVALGQALVFDKILSGNRDISCATCHDPSLNMSDGLSLSIGTGFTGHGATRSLGAGRQFVPRSAPTLVNQGIGINQMFWDGRVSGFRSGPFTTPAGSQLPNGLPSALAAQAMFPVTVRAEMRGNPGDVDVHGNPNELAGVQDSEFTLVWAKVMQRLMAVPAYVTMFRAAFPGQTTFTFREAAIAMAAFITGPLTLTDSPFDRYLAHNDNALSIDAKRGALLFFTTARCSQCHSGALLGGQQFANVGAPQIGPGVPGSAPLDIGKAAVDSNPFGPPSDFYRFSFRVAPLRNVELTAPYFHSGAYPTLEAVVRHYNDVETEARAYDPVANLAPPVRSAFHGGAVIDSVLGRLDFRLRGGLNLTAEQQRQLVAFLKSLTDDRARTMTGIRPASVPSGLPVD